RPGRSNSGAADPVRPPVRRRAPASAAGGTHLVPPVSTGRSSTLEGDDWVQLSHEQVGRRFTLRVCAAGGPVSHSGERCSIWIAPQQSRKETGGRLCSGRQFG